MKIISKRIKHQGGKSQNLRDPNFVSIILSLLVSIAIEILCTSLFRAPI